MTQVSEAHLTFLEYAPLLGRRFRLVNYWRYSSWGRVRDYPKELSEDMEHERYNETLRISLLDKQRSNI